MSTREHNMYYIAGRIEDEHQLVKLRDEIYTQTGVSLHNYTKRTPHVTFVNRIKLPKTQEPDINKELNQYNPASIPVEITGFCVWPSIDQPRYVSLTIETPIDTYQEDFKEIVTDKNGHILTDLPKPHITLFKCENPHEVGDYVKDKLRELQEEDLSITTRIPYIDLFSDRVEPTQTTEEYDTNPVQILND